MWNGVDYYMNPSEWATERDTYSELLEGCDQEL